ncbi:H(+)-transporting V1 sector ATPase subunit A [Mortierella antarctica]|nr:H(+)-transporting V1 sector ATPase subunit A [Mortierella antarctica]
MSRTGHQEQDRASDTDDDFAPAQQVNTRRFYEKQKQGAAEEQPQDISKQTRAWSRRLIVDEEDEVDEDVGTSHIRYGSRGRARPRRLIMDEEDEDEDGGTSHIRYGLRGRAMKRKELSDNDDDNDYGNINDTTTASTSTSSRPNRQKAKQPRAENENENTTAMPHIPWSIFEDKDVELVIGDWEGDSDNGSDENNVSIGDESDSDSSDDGFWEDPRFASMPFGPAGSDTTPTHRHSESNNLGEMFGVGARFGIQYPNSRSQWNHCSPAGEANGTSTTTNTSRFQAKPRTAAKAHGRTPNNKADDDPDPDPADTENDEDEDDGADDGADDDMMGFGENTRVFMASGKTKKIKDVHPGDYLLGPDCRPRQVVDTTIGRSHLKQVRELSRNVAHLPDSYFGLVTFTCTPKQSLHLATAQMQGEHVGHNEKGKHYVVQFRRLKLVQGTKKVVGSSTTFKDSLPGAKLAADGFAQTRSKAEKLAYLWGTWVGDGSSASPEIAVKRKDTDQITRLKDICYELGLSASLYKQSEKEKDKGSLGGSVGIKGRLAKRHNYFMGFLRLMGQGTSGSKRVPRWLRKESISVREHFLAGLMDSDGCRSQPYEYQRLNESTPHAKDMAIQRVPYSVAYKEGWTNGVNTRQPTFTIKLLPCSATANILSLCAVTSKKMPAPTNFTRFRIEYRYSAFDLDLVTAIYNLHELPEVPPQNPDMAQTVINQLHWLTLVLIAKRYQIFGYMKGELSVQYGVQTKVCTSFFSGKAENAKLVRFMKDQVFHRLPIEWLQLLLRKTRKPDRHPVVALTLDPSTDGLFVLGNNAVVTSREQV